MMPRQKTLALHGATPKKKGGPKTCIWILGRLRCKTPAQHRRSFLVEVA